MVEILPELSKVFFDFFIVTLLALIIGLEQRRHHNEQEETDDMLFGTDRTFTFIGILGFILFMLDPVSLKLFSGGGLVISIFLTIFYFSKIQNQKKSGLTSILSALITYCLAPLVVTQPQWLTLIIVVTVLIFTEMKEEFLEISKKFGKNEFITLAKFILIAGIILPNLPDKPVFSYITLSPYKMWLAIVVTAGISYFSYLLQKFVFTKKGIVVTGFLGGLYSSTAVSLVLSRKSRSKAGAPSEYASAILFATAVMYFRVFVVIFFIKPLILPLIYPYLILFFAITLITAIVINRLSTKSHPLISSEMANQQNPLEFRVALLFAVFYVIFSFLTHFTESHFGAGGLGFLSFVAGFADVDSYILNLLQGKFNITDLFLIVAIIATTTANNIIKMIYCMVLSEKKTKQLVMMGFGIMIAVNIAAIVYLYFSN